MQRGVLHSLDKPRIIHTIEPDMAQTRKQEIITQLSCSAAVFALAYPGPALPITAIIVFILGTVIILHRHRCMQGQPWSLWFTGVCLLWLWVNTAINLSPLFTFAPLSLALQAAACILCLCGGGLSFAQRMQRVGAFFMPVGFLALIPYALRASATGTILTWMALALLVANFIFSMTGVIWPATRKRPLCANLLFLTAIATSLGISFLVGDAFYGIFLIFTAYLPTAIAALAWGRRWSDHIQRSCGITSGAWLCLLSTLSALAPLGILCYAYNLLCFFD